MRISFSNINNNIYNNKPTTFKSQLKGKHCTYFCRQDLEWDKFCKFLENKYKNKDKVNSFILGGSDGSETYSYIMKMFINLTKNKALKFMPAKTVEQNPLYHSIAESGNVPLTSSNPSALFHEITNIARELFQAPKSYFEIADKKMLIGSEIKEHAEFINDNLLNVLPQIPKSDTVLLIRNTLPYLNESEQLKAMSHLHKMDKSCTVVVGNYDSEPGNQTKLLLWAIGFRETGLKNVFEKAY